MNWQSENWKNRRQSKSLSQGLDRPYGSRVSSVSPDNERAIIKNWSTKGRLFPIPHPFVSIGAWIRAMPQEGTQYLTVTRSDSNTPQMTGTFYDDSSSRLNRYRSGIGMYRPLLPGEIEMHSIGQSQVYLTRRSILNTRAGIIERTSNQDELKTFDRAPIHHKTFFLNKSGTLGDEHKVGIVERYRNSWQKFYPKQNEKFLAEEFFELKNPGKESPAIMFRQQRGHVVDADGAPINHAVTSLPLRYQAIYFANDDTDTRFEVDQLGNYLIRLSPAAADGYQLEVPNGNAIYRINKDWKADIEANRTTTIGGTDSLDITGARKVIVGEDTSYETTNFDLIASDAVNMEMNDFNVQAQGAVQYQSQGPMVFESLGTAQFSGLGGTNVGNAASPTVVAGSTVALAGGGAPIGRLGDKIVGQAGPIPVVGVIAQGSPKVTSA